MNEPNTLFYVANPMAGADFYAGLFAGEVKASSPTFAMVFLDSGVRLGLWIKSGVQPAATAAGGCELVFAVPDRESLDTWYARCRQKEVRIALEPTELDFGVTFVALDPDGHRLRFFFPTPA